MQRLIAAFKNSISGIKMAFCDEAAFRQEVFLAAILLPASFIIEATIVERILLIFSVFIVLITELLNSGIEAAIDRISQDRHHLSKKAKDVASAAVLFSLINMVITWVMVILN